MTDAPSPIDVDDAVSDAPADDAIYDALAHPCRICAIEVLGEREGPIDLADLASAIADRAADVDSDRLPADPERLEIFLYHVHAPKLSEAGFCEFDPETGTVVPTDAAATLEPLVESGSPST